MILSDENIDFLSISDTLFEEVCFETLFELGFKGLIWRQGGADNGRDIEGYFQTQNPLIDGVIEKWFFECKRYEGGVPPEQLNSKIAWADAEKPKHLVFFISSYLSNNARTWLEKISQDKPYHIHVIESVLLKKIIIRFENIVNKYFMNQYEKLLFEAQRNWLVHNIFPDVSTLMILSYHLDFSKLTNKELGFFWTVAKHREGELDELLVDDQQLILDRFFFEIANRSNTKNPIITEDLDISTIQITHGINDWEITYPNYIIAKLILNKSTRPIPAIYSLIFDSEGEGVETLVQATSDFPTLIRSIKKKAKTEARNIGNFLLSRTVNDKTQ
ncbi:MAG: restriction endonuclease [Anaerolineaceae bacterium]